MKSLLRWLHAAVSGLAALGVLAFALGALITVADILGRPLGLAVIGVVDLVQLFVMMGAWFVIPYAFLTGAHVGVDLVVNALPQSLGRAARAFAALVSVALLALMLWYGYASFQTQLLFGDQSQQLGIPIMWYWLPLLAGLAVSILAALAALMMALQPETAP